jgi:hypothetical protein
MTAFFLSCWPFVFRSCFWLPLRVKGAPSVNAGARRQPEPLTRKNTCSLSYGEQAALCGLLAMQAGVGFRVLLLRTVVFIICGDGASRDHARQLLRPQRNRVGAGGGGGATDITWVTRAWHTKPTRLATGPGLGNSTLCSMPRGIDPRTPTAPVPAQCRRRGSSSVPTVAGFLMALARCLETARRLRVLVS